MADFYQVLLSFIAQGGAGAIIGILLGGIIFLALDRKSINKHLLDTIQKVYDAKDSETRSVKDIVERYYVSNTDLINALNEIKIVLTTIKNNKR